LASHQPEVTIGIEVNTSFTEQASEFVHALRRQGKSDTTVRAYVSDVTAWMAECRRVGVNPDRVDSDTLAKCIRAYIMKYRDEVSPATTNRRMCSLRSYFSYFYMGDPLHDYKAPPIPTGKAHPLPNLMDDVRAMIAVTKPRSDARLAIALCGFAGLRVTEARAVCWHDIGPAWLEVHGKGGKQRDVPIAPELHAIIAEHHCPSKAGDPLIEMTDRGVRRAIAAAGRKANIARPVASHDLRMTFGTVIYSKTKDLRVTQELLGHASPVTTERYTGITEATKSAAVAAALP
jgi:site-specific recombinase XerD